MMVMNLDNVLKEIKEKILSGDSKAKFKVNFVMANGSFEQSKHTAINKLLNTLQNNNFLVKEILISTKEKEYTPDYQVLAYWIKLDGKDLIIYFKGKYAKNEFIINEIDAYTYHGNIPWGIIKKYLDLYKKFF